MQVELRCPRCECQFTFQPNTPVARAIDRITEQDPWGCMGDGATVEDSLHAALTAAGPIRCPECGANVPVTEEDLSTMAREMLAHW